MAIHGIASTYFGDYEYDIGKSVTWTKYFVDDMYVMDTNISGSNRQYIINWDYLFPNVKYSFNSKPFFGSAATAAAWRKESFTRAKSAFAYDDDDWVLFIDGTECLSVFHKPPREITITEAELVTDPTPQYPSGGEVTFTTDSPHDISVTNLVQVQFANIVDGTETYNLDGRYEVTAVTSTTFTVYKSSVLADVAMEPLVSNATGLVTEEPSGYLGGDLFQPWLTYEINNALDAGNDLITLDAWAMVRSDPVEVSTFTTTPYVGKSVTYDVVSSDKSYLSMKRLVRLAKVSALSNLSFDWTVLDQPAVSFVGGYDAERLSLISYAYCRWADSPKKMTQSADNTAPNYAVGDYIDPFLVPVNQSDDIGYKCRQYISTVRPIEDLPVADSEWGLMDPIDSKPVNGDGVQILKTTLYPVQAFVGPTLETVSYRKYGGSEAYPGVFRGNLREGLWYTSQGAPPRSTAISAISVAGGVAVATTPKGNSFFPGYKVAVYGTDAVFDGEYIVSSVTPTSFSFSMVTEPGYTNSESYTSAYAITKPKSLGPVPWDYSTNTIAISDVAKYVNLGIINGLKS